MRQYIISIWFVLALQLMWGLISCTDEKNTAASVGYLYLGVEENDVMITRTAKPVTDEKLRVDIMSTSGDTVKSYADYLKEVKGQKLILPVGNYKIVVSSNENGGAAWESPFYAGETEEPIAVKNGEITNTSVTCKIANTKVTVTYKESLKKFFIDYCDTVSTSTGKLVYTRDEYRAGYFTSEGNLTAKLYLKNKDGNEFTLQRIVKDIKPQYHYNLIYSLDDDSEGEAGSDINISVDPNDPTEINCNISIKQEDLFGKGAPELKVTGFNGEENTLTWRPVKKEVAQPLPDSNPTLILKAPAGIQDMQIHLNTSFSRLTKRDLGIDETLVSTKEGQEIGLNALLEKAYNGNKFETTETYRFEIVILDKLNQEAIISFSLEFTPDLSVETLDANAFSTFVFMRGKADETENLRFKYWKGKDDEANAEEINAIATDDGNFGAVITTLEPNTQYYYKALAGEEEGGKVGFVTEAAGELPGGHFDKWDSNTPIGVLSSENVISPFWSSGNNNGVGGIGATPNLLTKTEDVATKTSNLNNEYAANLQSTDAMVVGLAAGNLFTGNFSVISSLSNPGGTIDLGRSFYSRPTKLRGYLKYTPGDVDCAGDVIYPSSNKVVVTKGEKDICSVYIALSKKPFTVTTTSKDQSNVFEYGYGEFKDLIIAYAELPEEQAQETNGYVPFEITLKYTQPDYHPESGDPYYIIIVCSASKYGDFYKGSTGSNLKLDEFELGYEYDENCFN